LIRSLRIMVLCYDSCMSECLSLGAVIQRLRREDPERKVAYGFGNPHSYRGYYQELCFEPVLDTTVGAMLEAAESSVGKTFTGWKGGDFTMGLYTDCYLNFQGHCMLDGEDALSEDALNMMLATIEVDDYVTALYRKTVIATRPEDVVLVIRRPDDPNSYVLDSEESRIRIVDLDLGNSFDESHLDEDDRDAVEELATSILGQLSDLDEFSEVRRVAEDTLGDLLEQVGLTLEDVQRRLAVEPELSLSL
jgi:hypothetical protein